MTTAVRAEPAHEAVVYASDQDLARLLAPRIEMALRDGQAVVAVLAAESEAALRDGLGAAADTVEFADPAQVHAVPAFTAAVRLARVSRRAGRALVIGQHLPGLPGCGPGHWARFDIALNVAIAELPVTVLCPYTADDPDLPLAHTTHPLITDEWGSKASSHYRPPREALVDHPPPPPPDLGPPVAELTFGAGDLVALRRLVGGVAAGVAPERAADLVLAVNELASNSIEHGPGSGRLRIWADDPLIAEVSDRGGSLDVPFPGLALPPPEGARGRGLWLASELCDVLQVWSDDGSTVIRVQLDR
jgi:anti-sigma regulatory factor (Ser/Thr protein kinase)